MKLDIFSQLLNNCTHKYVILIITSTAKQESEYQETLDIWLDIDNKLQGDSILVVGNRDTEPPIITIEEAIPKTGSYKFE